LKNTLVKLNHEGMALALGNALTKMADGGFYYQLVYKLKLFGL